MARDSQAADRLHHHSHRGLPAADFHHRSHRRLFPCAGASPWASRCLTSLALALTWTPTLSHYLLRRKLATNRSRLRKDALSKATQRGHNGPHPPCAMTACCECTLRASISPRPVLCRPDRRVLFLLPQPRFGPPAGDGRRRFHSATTSCPPDRRSKKPTASSHTWSRSSAPSQKSKVRPAGPVCNLVSPP